VTKYNIDVEYDNEKDGSLDKLSRVAHAMRAASVTEAEITTFKLELHNAVEAVRGQDSRAAFNAKMGQWVNSRRVPRAAARV
jgi:hypothetical protein